MISRGNNKRFNKTLGSFIKSKLFLNMEIDNMTLSVKDKIRAATLGKKSAIKSKVFDYEGIEVEVREPNLKSKRELLKRAKDSNGELDVVDFMIYATILNTYSPGTDELVFSIEDYDVMANQYSDSFIDKFSSEISALMNAEEMSEKNE